MTPIPDQTRHHAINKVYVRTGKRTHPINLILGKDVRPSRGEAPEVFALILDWPRDCSFLAIEAEFGAPPTVQRLVPGIDAVLALTQKYGCPAPPRNVPVNFLSGEVRRGAELRLRLIVDTDRQEFEDKAATLSGGEPMLVTVSTTLLAGAGQDAERLVGAVLQLAPARMPLAYRGAVALDLGNTATALACLPAGKHRPVDIAILSADEVPPRLVAVGTSTFLPEPSKTQLRIDRLARDPDTPQEVADSFRGAMWEAGLLADGPSSGLVLGAKRLAADRLKDAHGRDRPMTIFAADSMKKRDVERRPLLVSRGLPAELYVCRLLQRFREATGEEATDLAVTYPSTYSVQELTQLRDVVYRGFLRAAGREQTRTRLSEWSKHLLLLLDEATAASFYFVYRKLMQPGGLPRFRYFYPQGMNLLLYDCGGGTTDVALVSARAAPGADKLSMEVRARSGLRTFGGDDITIAVFKLLKAKIALTAGDAKKLLGPNDPATTPKQVKDLKPFLEQHAALFERLVPTTFRPEVLDHLSGRNRAHTLQLWALAEQVKRGLENQKEARLTLPQESNPQRSPLVHFLAPADDKNRPKVLSQLGEIVVTRLEVDELIRDRIEQSIDGCNRLIETKLTANREEVHWIVAAGNASRYPLIRELFKQRLDVHFFDDRFEKVEQADLKLSVAKGAALALAARKRTGGLIEFPEDLCDRLPYDIGVFDFREMAPLRLFDEHLLYKELSPRQVPMKTVAGDTDEVAGKLLTDVPLFRRWPGSRLDGDLRGYEEFQTYHFEQGAQGGAIVVRYDATRDPPDFVVEDGQKNEGTLVIKEEDTYLSPLQRGTL